VTGQAVAVVEPVGVVAAPTTAAEVATAWLLGYSNAGTRAEYGRDLREWGGWLERAGVTDPLAAHRSHVEAFARTLEAEGRARSTVARKLAALSGYYRFAEDEGLIARSPVRVRRPRGNGDSQKMGLDRDETRALVRAARASSPRDHALVLVLALNGLRISEALGADVADLGTERGHRTLRIVRKGGKHAAVPLAPVTGEAVDAMLSGRPIEGPLFATATGRRMDRRSAFKVIRRLAREAGLSKAVGPHTLRHGYVAQALDAGATLRDVQLAVGHASPTTTVAYDRQRQALDSNPTYVLAATLSD
jgi:integrase/recombinase XerD